MLLFDVEVCIIVKQHVGRECGLRIKEGARGDVTNVEDQVGHRLPLPGVHAHTLPDLLHDPT